jgi:SAM-dependent methyltransferase
MSHSHSHGHDVDFVSANRAHYDSSAGYYDRPDRIELARRLAPHILHAHAFDPDRTTLLDYACGTGIYHSPAKWRCSLTEAEGLISQALAAHTASIVGADVSQGMVDTYNMRVADHGIGPDEMRAVVVPSSFDDLANTLCEHLFEVAVVCMLTLRAHVMLIGY